MFHLHVNTRTQCQSINHNALVAGLLLQVACTLCGGFICRLMIKAQLSTEILSRFTATLSATFPFNNVYSLFKIVAAATDLGQSLDDSCW